MKFNYHTPINIVFGNGRVSEISTHVGKYGKRTLVVTGKTSTKKTGLLERVLQLLKNNGIVPILFDQVESNPLTTTAITGARIAKENCCDSVIGLGGGSIMDAAKAIAFIVENGEEINDYIFNKKISDKALPIVLVPTTCGTGSEGNGFSVLSNPDNNDKKSLRCNAIIPKVSIVDPELMVTMPKSVYAAVVFDALSHNMEAYISKLHQPMTDMLALEGIRLIYKNIFALYEGKGTERAWEELTWASTIGGMVIHSTAVIAPHGLEHPASGCKNIVHGRGLAALTPVIFERSICGDRERFATISRLLGGKNEKDLVFRLQFLLRKIQMETTLSKEGITKSDIAWMTENACKVSAAALQYHPVTFSKEDITLIYQEAL